MSPVFRKILKKFKKITLINLIERIPNKRVVHYLLPRLYFYFKFAPRSLILDIVSRCNAACPFCPKTILEVKGAFMPEAVFYKAVDEARALGIRHCRLYTTGEPLLHPKFAEFVTYLNKNRFQTLLSTNGQFLSRHFEAVSLIDEVKFSIEGWDKESYEHYRKNCDFEVVYDNLKRFREFLKVKQRKPFVIISGIVLKETNLKEFHETWEPLADRIDSYPIQEVFQFVDRKIKILSFQNNPRLQKNMYTWVHNGEPTQYCGDPFEHIFISSTGKGFLCCGDFKEHFDMGEIGKNTLKEIIWSPLRRQVQRQFLRQSYTMCQGCPSFKKLDSPSQKDFDEKLASFAQAKY